MARQQARRRTRERLAGIGLAILGVVVLIVAVFAIRDPRNGGHVAASSPGPSSSSPAPHPKPAKPRSARRSRPTQATGGGSSAAVGSSAPISLAQAQRVPLVVLNNTTIEGLAAQAAERFQSSGWTVSSVGNLVNDIISTCAYYDPHEPGAKAAAHALKREFPTIKRVRPKFPQLPAGPIVVVLTPDYAPQ